MRTRATRSGQRPRFSAAVKIAASAKSNRSVSLQTALGAKLSAPIPVETGKVHAASRICAGEAGGNAWSMERQGASRGRWLPIVQPTLQPHVQPEPGHKWEPTAKQQHWASSWRSRCRTHHPHQGWHHSKPQGQPCSEPSPWVRGSIEMHRVRAQSVSLINLSLTSRVSAFLRRASAMDLSMDAEPAANSGAGVGSANNRHSIVRRSYFGDVPGGRRELIDVCTCRFGLLDA